MNTIRRERAPRARPGQEREIPTMKRMIAGILALILMLAFSASAASDGDRSITTGLPTDHEARIMVCQMDNEPGARPQKGIGSADIVYEVEIYDGGYTRYTAVFNDTIPEQIEAVRSARIVHADICYEYQGAFIHYGGQKYPGSDVYYTFKILENFGTRYDGINGDRDFYRDRSRKSPNNVICNLKNLYDRTDWSTMVCKSPLRFRKKFAVPKQGEAVTKFRVPYQKKAYCPGYVWDAELKRYRRYYNDKPYVDGATDEQVLVDNIIVQHVEYDWFEGKSDRPKVELTGENKCDYFIGGKHFTGTWKRSKISKNTVYFDENGKKVKLNPGTTYIQLLRTERDLEILE